MSMFHTHGGKQRGIQTHAHSHTALYCTYGLFKLEALTELADVGELESGH